MNLDTSCSQKPNVLGGARRNAEAGDRIAAIHGSNGLFVLRQYVACWKIIGTCYIQGLMKGEAFVEGADDVERIALC